MLLHPGEGEYQPDLQVVQMGGFRPAHTTDVDKMIRSQVEEIAKNNMANKDIKKLKVDQHRPVAKKLDQSCRKPESNPDPGC